MTTLTEQTINRRESSYRERILVFCLDLSENNGVVGSSTHWTKPCGKIAKFGNLSSRR